jgi:hypothetical protein
MKLFCVFVSSKCNWMQQDCSRVLVLCLQSVYLMFNINNSVVQSFNLQGEEEETQLRIIQLAR